MWYIDTVCLIFYNYLLSLNMYLLLLLEIIYINSVLSYCKLRIQFRIHYFKTFVLFCFKMFDFVLKLCYIITVSVIDDL